MTRHDLKTWWLYGLLSIGIACLLTGVRQPPEWKTVAVMVVGYSCLWAYVHESRKP